MKSLVIAAGLIVGSLLAALSPLAADAHETRVVGDGKYQIVVGFKNEPVFAGDKSGLEFWVTEAPEATPAADAESEGTPVEGLDETLQAEVIFEDQTMELPLSAMWDEPGGYGSDFFPSEPGTYSFRIYGAIGDTEIDETFTSGPETFGDVQDPAPLQFPKQ
jgi:hypothetical protein